MGKNVDAPDGFSIERRNSFHPGIIEYQATMDVWTRRGVTALEDRDATYQNLNKRYLIEQLIFDVEAKIKAYRIDQNLENPVAREKEEKIRSAILETMKEQYNQYRKPDPIMMVELIMDSVMKVLVEI